MTIRTHPGTLADLLANRQRLRLRGVITKESIPSSPIGVQWEFQPRSVALSDPSIRATAVDVWSLPLEPVMSYGGAVSDFVRDVGARAQLVFRSSEPAVGDTSRWDLVHRSQLSEMFNTVLPAYVVFDSLKLLASQLPSFEKELFKETDATLVLPVTTDLIFLKELLLKTRLQLSVDLDHLPVVPAERTRIFEMIFKDQLRVSEIRLQPTSENLALWEEIVFDYGCSAAAILKWDEPQTPWSHIKTAVANAQALRSGVQAEAVSRAVGPAVSAPKLSPLDQAFAEVFPQLQKQMPLKILKDIWSDFLEALGEDGSREWEPYSQLRLWPMFLKMHADETTAWVELAQTEWARFSAEFHPADETVEQMKLLANEVKANPSLQTVGTKTAIIAIARNRQFGSKKLHEEDLDWMSAALIDEISEAAKTTEANLLQHALQIRAPEGAQPSQQEWAATLKKLIAHGVILSATP